MATHGELGISLCAHERAMRGYSRMLTGLGSPGTRGCGRPRARPARCPPPFKLTPPVPVTVLHGDVPWQRESHQERGAAERGSVGAGSQPGRDEAKSPTSWQPISALSGVPSRIAWLTCRRGNIPSELAPQSWSRFCDNVYGLLRAVASERREKEPVALSRSARRRLDGSTDDHLGWI